MKTYKIFYTGCMGMNKECIDRIPDSTFNDYNEALSEFNRIIKEEAEEDEAVYLWYGDKLIKVWND